MEIILTPMTIKYKTTDKMRESNDTEENKNKDTMSTERFLLVEFIIFAL